MEVEVEEGKRRNVSGPGNASSGSVWQRSARRLFAALTFSTQSPRRECLSYHQTPPEGARTPSPN